MASRIKIFFDGGHRPAPIGMETAVVIGGAAHIRRDLGPGSAMEAEWCALVDAARLADELGLRDVQFIGDSLPVVNQANGVARCGDGNARHLETFRMLAPSGARVRHIKRSQNLAGIALSRLHER